MPPSVFPFLVAVITVWRRGIRHDPTPTGKQEKRPMGENTWWALYHGGVDCLLLTIGQIYSHLPLVVLLILQKLAVFGRKLGQTR